MYFFQKSPVWLNFLSVSLLLMGSHQGWVHLCTLCSTCTFSLPFHLADYTAVNPSFLCELMSFSSSYRIVPWTVYIEISPVENIQNDWEANYRKEIIMSTMAVSETWEWLCKEVWQTEGLDFLRGADYSLLLTWIWELKALYWQHACHRHLWWNKA